MTVLERILAGGEHIEVVIPIMRKGKLLQRGEARGLPLDGDASLQSPATDVGTPNASHEASSHKLNKYRSNRGEIE